MRLGSLSSPCKARTKRSYKETLAVNYPPCGHECGQASILFASAPLETNHSNMGLPSTFDPTARSLLLRLIHNTSYLVARPVSARGYHCHSRPGHSVNPAHKHSSRPTCADHRCGTPAGPGIADFD